MTCHMTGLMTGVATGVLHRGALIDGVLASQLGVTGRVALATSPWKSVAAGVLLQGTLARGLLGAVTLAVVTVAMRRQLLNRSLRARRSFAQLLPTDSFNPSPEAIRRWASQLSRTHRTSRASGSGPAHGLRIRVASGEGAVTYSVEGHQRAQSLFMVAAYDGVERIQSETPEGGGGGAPGPAQSEGLDPEEEGP
jgi:hypothetical protein